MQTDDQHPRPARDRYYTRAQELMDGRGMDISKLARAMTPDWQQADIRATVRAAVRGQRAGKPTPLPSMDTVEALDRALTAEGELVALWRDAMMEDTAVRIRLNTATPRTSTEDRDRSLRTPAVPEGEDTTDRRTFAALAALSTLAATTRQRIAEGGAPDRTLDDLESDVDEIARIYGSAPPARLLPEVAGRWKQVEEVLEGRMSSDMRSRVTLLAGQLSYFIGRLAFNVEDLRCARQFAGLAGLYAEETGEPVLLMSVATLHSSVAYHTGRYHQAAAALRPLNHLRHPYMDARVAAYQARTRAKLGDAEAARAALDQMEATACSHTPIPGETPVGPAAVAMFRAGVAIILGDGVMAREWAPVAVDGYRRGGGDFTVEEAHHADATLAHTHLLGPDAAPEEAVKIVSGILAARPTHTVMARLRQCAGTFTPAQRRIPAVSEFVDRCRALPAGQSAR